MAASAIVLKTVQPNFKFELALSAIFNMATGALLLN